MFSEPYRVEDDANPWSDVADVGVEESPPWPPAPSDKDRARFLDINRWRQTANGNLSTLVAMARGQGCRIVLFQHKKTPTFGRLRIDLETDEEVFSKVRYATRDAALEGAWRDLCAIW